jgi:hypothetical protein
MIDNSTDTTTDYQDEDDLRHAFAVGTVAVRGIIDRLTVIALEGRPLTADDLHTVRDQLQEVWEELYGITIGRLGWDLVDDEEARDYCQDRYSDGRAVVSIVRPAVLATNRRYGYSRDSWPEQQLWSEQEEAESKEDGIHYNGDLWWNPCVTVTVDDVDMSPGPTPEGLEVHVDPTPYALAAKERYSKPPQQQFSTIRAGSDDGAPRGLACSP